MIVNLIVIPIIIILILARFDAFNSRHHIVEYEIKNDNIKQDIKIVLITDHHGCYYGDEQEDLIDDIMGIKPDLVLYSGDIFDDRLPYDNTIKLISKIGKSYPSFYAVGNHEVRTDELDIIKDIARENGLQVLEGTNARISIKTNNILLGGIDDPELGLEQFELLEKPNDDEFSILLSHRPELVNEYNDLGYDLVVSGHAHGGQWRIPKYLNGIYAPNQGLFPKYAGGRYDLDNTTLIVSRGLARESTTRIIPRVFNRPEIVLIKLTK